MKMKRNCPLRVLGYPGDVKRKSRSCYKIIKSFPAAVILLKPGLQLFPGVAGACPGHTACEVRDMEPTYSDLYALLERDPKAGAYFRSLPGYVQDQIRSKKHQPGSYEALVEMAEAAEKVV